MGQVTRCVPPRQTPFATLESSESQLWYPALSKCIKWMLTFLSGSMCWSLGKSFLGEQFWLRWCSNVDWAAKSLDRYLIQGACLKNLVPTPSETRVQGDFDFFGKGLGARQWRCGGVGQHRRCSLNTEAVSKSFVSISRLVHIDVFIYMSWYTRNLLKYD